MLVREGLARFGYVPFELLGEIGAMSSSRASKSPLPIAPASLWETALFSSADTIRPPPLLLGTEMLCAKSIIFPESSPAILQIGDLRHGESFGMESRLNVALVSR